MVDLKPCPICGAKANVAGFGYSPYISCENNHEFTPSHSNGIGELIDAWNHRIGEPKRVCANCKNCDTTTYKHAYYCRLLGYEVRAHADRCDDWEGME